MRRHSLLALAAITILVVFLYLLTGQKWADILVDSGYNLYTFWQLSEGKILFRDLAYYHGPLSPLLCAALFKIFGVSISVLTYANAVLAIVISYFIYRIFLWASNLASAILACFIFLFFFAFAHYTYIANYNYIFPYKHEALHGIFLCLSMIFLSMRWTEKKEKIYPILIGFCLGACLLTSSEMVLAGVLTAIGALLLFHLPVFLFCVGTLLAPAGMFFYLAQNFSWLQSLHYTFNAILFPMQQLQMSQNIFFQRSVGTDHLRESIIITVISIFGIALAVFSIQVLSWKWKALSEKLKKEYAILLGLFFVLVAILLPVFVKPWLWDYTRSFPFFCLIFLYLTGRKIVMSTNYEQKNTAKILFLWGVLSLSLLLKMFWNARIEHYGFYLAMPAMLCFANLMFYVLPDYCENYGIDSYNLRASVVGFMLGIGIIYSQTTLEIYLKKDLIVGEKGDAIITWSPTFQPHGLYVAQTLDWVEKNTAKSSTLLTLPEATILNYFSKRQRPGPYTMNFVEYLSQGEETILKIWKENPPDTIILVQQNSSEFGLAPFGVSEQYGKKTMDWIKQEYREAIVFGAIPFRPEGKFGIQILQKNKH